MALLALAVAAQSIFSSCTCSQNPMPKSPHWGQVSCAHCRMAVSDKKAAAQLVGPGYRVHYYDDLGCALEHRKADKTLADWQLYMIDPSQLEGNEHWIETAKLRFSEGHHTPMGYGFLPAVDGKLSFDEVQGKIFK